jgi:hypothetical protein
VAAEPGFVAACFEPLNAGRWDQHGRLHNEILENIEQEAARKRLGNDPVVAQGYLWLFRRKRTFTRPIALVGHPTPRARAARPSRPAFAVQQPPPVTSVLPNRKITALVSTREPLDFKRMPA